MDMNQKLTLTLSLFVIFVTCDVHGVVTNVIDDQRSKNDNVQIRQCQLYEAVADCGLKKGLPGHRFFPKVIPVNGDPVPPKYASTSTIYLPFHVTRIYLAGNALTRLRLDELLTFPNLSHLDLTRNEIEKVEGLSSSVNGSGLLNLKLSHNRLGHGKRKTSLSLRGLVSLKSLWLDHNGLATLHPSLFRDAQSLTFLRLDANFLGPIFESRSFITLSSLEILNVSSNDYRKIGVNALKGFPRLRSLDLSRNRIISLARSCFSQAPHLRVLNLRENRLRTLEPRSLASITTTLSLLDLGRNRLKRVPVRALHHTRGLRRLFLDGNSFSAVRRMAFYSLPSLEELWLGENAKMREIDRSAFDGLFRLKKLVLSGNVRLKRIDDGAFPVGSLPKLETVLLNKAGLTNVSLKWFLGANSLRFVDFAGNPLFCDCHLSPFKSILDSQRSVDISTDALSSHHVYTNLTASSAVWQRRLAQSDLRCHGPHNLRGSSLTRMSASLLTCEVPVILKEQPEAGTLTLKSGDDVVVRILVSGLGSPSVRWLDSAAVSIPWLNATVDVIKENLEKPGRQAYQSVHVSSDGEVESSLFIFSSSYLSSGEYKVVVTNAGGSLTRTYVVNVASNRNSDSNGDGGGSQFSWRRRRGVVVMIVLSLLIAMACIFQKRIMRFKYEPKRMSNA